MKRRDQMVKLREAGLTLAQIGKRLGITRQRVQKTLSLSGKLRVVPIRCRKCGNVITRLRIVARHQVVPRVLPASGQTASLDGLG